MKPKYQFSQLPNNAESWELIAQMKTFLNSRYKIRVRGQGLNSEGKKIGWRKFTFGAPLKYSTHLRVYIIDTQKGF